MLGIRHPYEVKVEKRRVSFHNVDFLYWLEGDDFAFENYTGDDLTGPYVEWKDHHETWISHVKNFNTVIQAGGNNGLYPRFYGELFDHVISFEPRSDCFEVLSMNCQGDKFKLYNKGLWSDSVVGACVRKVTDSNDYNKTFLVPADIVDTDNTGMTIARPVDFSKIPDSSKLNVTIELITIDSIQPNAVDLIHLDLEGNEYEALKGAEQTIDRFKPTIIAEAGNVFREVNDFLKSKGYNYQGEAHDHIWTID